MTHKRGRPSIEERFGKEKLIKAYETHGTLRSAAEALGISHVALAAFFKANNIKYKNRSKALVRAKRFATHSGAIAEFLERNKHLMLPRDFTKLAFLAGCSRNSVSCYFYRRRKRIKNLLTSLPNVKTLDLVMQDELGNNYKTKDFKSYEYLIDKFTLKVTILAVLKDSSQVLIPIEDAESFIKRLDDLS